MKLVNSERLELKFMDRWNCISQPLYYFKYNFIPVEETHFFFHDTNIKGHGIKKHQVNFDLQLLIEKCLPTFPRLVRHAFEWKFSR